MRLKDSVCSIDFEYHSSEEKNLHLVCCSLIYKNRLYEYWLNDETDKAKLIRNLERINLEGFALLCFNATAEGRALLSLGLDVRKFNWVCLNAEWKMLTNHFHKYQYGKQYIDGKYVETVPPKNKYSMNEEQIKNMKFSKARHNLLACTYKMLGTKERDSEYKDRMRDIILTKDFNLIQDKKREILDYCSSDIKNLPEIMDRTFKAYDEYFGRFVPRWEGQVTSKEVLWRGETMARTAIMMAEGYPVDVPKLKKFADNIPNILRDLIEDINSQFDWDLFSPNKSAHGYKQNQKEWKKFISDSEHADGWLRTAKGDYALSLEAFDKKFSWRHEFPRGNFYAQALRFLKTKQALNGFNTDPTKKNIFKDLGSDGRVRAYLNPYGSQSARYQPPSTSFMFLKPAWTRTLVHPSSNRAICGIDYKSEEALIGALNSNDKAMIEAYKSGDVYLDFAKRAGAIPPHGTKEEYKKERDLFKSTYLGISYLMGAKSLAKKLTADTGTFYSEAQADVLIKKFYEAYPDYARYLKRVEYSYEDLGYVKLEDGWVMFGDNDNFRSVSNMPIQGMGSCILRKAIQLAQDRGLQVIIPLHDAIYIEYAAFELENIKMLAECMTQAFVECYPNNPNASLIKLDIETWSSNYEQKQATYKNLEIHFEKLHVDPRGREEYERYKKYML
jgi:DNA polymerase-1